MDKRTNFFKGLQIGMSDISKHMLYSVLVQVLTDSFATEGQIELTHPEPTIAVGDNPELDKKMLANLQAAKEISRQATSILQEFELSAGSLLCEEIDERETKAQKRQRFSHEVVSLLNDWLFSNKDNPFPSPEEKELLATQAGLTVAQVSQWFTNARRRHLKKKIS